MARLAEDVRLFFADSGTAEFDNHVISDLDHGRSKIRRHLICHEVHWLTTDRRNPGEPRVPGFKAIAVVEALVERGDKTSVERRHFLSSLPSMPSSTTVP